MQVVAAQRRGRDGTEGADSRPPRHAARAWFFGVDWGEGLLAGSPTDTTLLHFRPMRSPASALAAEA